MEVKTVKTSSLTPIETLNKTLNDEEIWREFKIINSKKEDNLSNTI